MAVVAVKTEYVSTQSYITLFSVKRIFESLKRQRKKNIVDKDSILWSIVNKKLKGTFIAHRKRLHEKLFASRVLDTRFRNDILRGGDVLIE